MAPSALYAYVTDWFALRLAVLPCTGAIRKLVPHSAGRGEVLFQHRICPRGCKPPLIPVMIALDTALR